MYKKISALILASVLITSNIEGLVIYAQDKQSTEIERTNTEQSNQDSKVSSMHNVYNTEELKNAINNANQGDIIKVYEGTYSDAEITITKSDITIQGYTLDDKAISSNKDAIPTNTKFKIHADDVTLNGIETKDINIGYESLTTDYIIANNTKIINCSIMGSMNIGSIFGKEVSNNTLVEGCYVSLFIKVNGSNNIIRDTETDLIELRAGNTLIDKCNIGRLAIGSPDRAVENVKLQDSTVSRSLELGRYNQIISDIILEKMNINIAKIGYYSGNVNSVSISDSKIDDCWIGVSNRGRANNTSIINTDIEGLRIAEDTGSAKNTKIVNSNITQGLYIGNDRGIAEDTYVSNCNISKPSAFTSISLSIGISGGSAKNTKILSTNISENINIGDKSLDRNAINTLIETDNDNIVDNGENTVIFNYLNEGINKFKAQASQGLKIKLIKDGDTLIETIVGQDEIVNEYLKEEDPNFSLLPQEQLQLNIYDINNKQIFNEDMTIKELVISLPKPKADEISNISTHITGYVQSHSQVFVLKENQKESDEGVLSDRTGNGGYFKIEVDDLSNDKTLRIYSRDNSNNISEILEVEVLDKTVPEFINIEEITDKSSSIKGKVSESNVEIEAIHQGVLIGSAISDDNGNFEILVKTGQLKADQYINFTAYDEANNTSQYVVMVKDSVVFKDIAGHWASEVICYFVDKGYINGYEDNTFRPNNSITRAEFVTIVNNYFGLTKSSGKVFEDTKNHWAKYAIDVAVTNGICSGKTATEFKPNDPITREEASVMIASYKKVTDRNYDKLGRFKDAHKVSEWAKPGVEGTIEKGYMGGYSDGTFRPKDKITRAEAVATLSRIK